MEAGATQAKDLANIEGREAAIVATLEVKEAFREDSEEAETDDLLHLRNAISINSQAIDQLNIL